MIYLVNQFVVNRIPWYVGIVLGTAFALAGALLLVLNVIELAKGVYGN